MTRYRNGEIPASALITIASGTNGDGYWEHQLSPAQLVRHDALVARAKKRTGRILQITSGWCAYRPLGPQKVAKRKYGSGAAAVGFSSHGGTYKGRDAMAMDYGNWAWVYENGGGREAFFADCRAVGLTPGVIASESWHVIDYDPWAAVPSGTTPSNNSKPAVPEEDEDDVRIKFGHRSEGADEWMIVHPSLKGGYQVTTSQKRAIAWSRLYGRGWAGDESARYDFNVPRADYIELQAAAKAAAAGWVA